MLLGIDLGTGSAKALLLSLTGEAIAESSSPYLVNAPHPGWAESDPADWWQAVAIAVRAVVQDRADQVQAIGLSGQMHGVVLTDKNGAPLRPAILWADTRSNKVLEQYHALEPGLLDRLANPITTGMAGCSLLWLREHDLETYASARWAMQPKDWLRFHLTAAEASEPSDASGTLLYDVAADSWAWDLLDSLNLRSDWLPKLIPSSSIAGTLTPYAADQLGLPAGLPVTAGASDTAAAALGSGLIKPGPIQLTVGSGAQIVTIQSSPIADAQKRTHLFRAAPPNQWYTLAAIQNAGLALEWVKGILGLDWTQVYREAFTVPAGCEGLTFLPYLIGDRTPHLDPNARGAWVGLGLHHTRAHLMRAALEGVAFSLRQGLEAIASTNPCPESLWLAGGGTQENQWQQLLADVLQVPLLPMTVTAASARGAALLAGIGIGVYSSVDTLPQAQTPSALQVVPNPANANLEAAYQRFDALYPRLHHP